MNNKTWLRYGALYAGLYIILVLLSYASLSYCFNRAKSSGLDEGGCFPFAVLFERSLSPGTLVTMPLYKKTLKNNCKVESNFDEWAKQLDAKEKNGSEITIESIKARTVCDSFGNFVEKYYTLASVIISALFYFLIGIRIGKFISDNNKKVTHALLIFIGVFLIVSFVSPILMMFAIY